MATSIAALQSRCAPSLHDSSHLVQRRVSSTDRGNEPRDILTYTEQLQIMPYTENDGSPHESLVRVSSWSLSRVEQGSLLQSWFSGNVFTD